MSLSKSYRCPECKQSFTDKGKSFPFCGERCQLIDLGAWAAEKYRVPLTAETDEDGVEAVVVSGEPQISGPSRK